MKSRRSALTILLPALLFAAPCVRAAGIECDEDGGRIVDSQAAIVYVTNLEGERVAVSDDPEVVAGAEGEPVVTPDDLCEQGWIIPAPGPAETGPVPGPDAAGALSVSARPSDGSSGQGTGGRRAPARQEPASGAPSPGPGVSAGHIASVVIEASEEPTPTPARGAARRSLNAQAGHCAATGSSSSSLWSLLLLAGLRRRRGGR